MTSSALSLGAGSYLDGLTVYDRAQNGAELLALAQPANGHDATQIVWCETMASFNSTHSFFPSFHTMHANCTTVSQLAFQPCRGSPSVNTQTVGSS
jgi:hypothetical protein